MRIDDYLPAQSQMIASAYGELAKAVSLTSAGATWEAEAQRSTDPAEHDRCERLAADAYMKASIAANSAAHDAKRLAAAIDEKKANCRLSSPNGYRRADPTRRRHTMAA